MGLKVCNVRPMIEGGKLRVSASFHQATLTAT